MIVAVLKPDSKGKVSPEDIKAFLQKAVDEGKIPKYGLPDRYAIVDAIPKTSVGKINKIALREQYGK